MFPSTRATGRPDPGLSQLLEEPPSPRWGFAVSSRLAEFQRLHTCRLWYFQANSCFSALVAQRGRSRRVIQDSSEGKEVPGRQQVGAIAAVAALLAVFLSCKRSESRHSPKRRAGEPEPRAPWGGSEERPREAGEKPCKAPPGLAPGQLDHSLQRGCSELPQV